MPNESNSRRWNLALQESAVGVSRRPLALRVNSLARIAGSAQASLSGESTKFVDRGGASWGQHENALKVIASADSYLEDVIDG